MCQVTWASNFSMEAVNIFSTITAGFVIANKCISSHAPRRNHQTSVRFTGHSRTVTPQYRTCFMSSSWQLEFGGAFQISGRNVGTYYCVLLLVSMANFQFGVPKCKTTYDIINGI